MSLFKFDSFAKFIYWSQTEDCAELQLLNLSQNHVCTLP